MPPRGLVVALEGPSGVGKSTVAARAAGRFGWALLAEAYDRLDRRPRLDFHGESELLVLEHELLREEARRFRDAVFLARRGTLVLADTGFLGPVSYTAGLVATGRCSLATYRRLVGRARRYARSGRLGLPDLSVFLDVPRGVRDARLRRDALRHPAALRGRHREVARFESEVLRPWWAARLGSRVRVLRSDSRPDDLASRLAGLVASGTPLRAPCARLDRLLGELAAAELPGRGSRAGATVMNGTSPRPLPSR